MIRFFQILAYTSVILYCAGSSDSKQDSDIWEHTKLGDLRPIYTAEQADKRLLKPINFDIYIIEMPAENIGALDNIWQLLHSEQLRPADPASFEANLFQAGFGQVEMWDEVGEFLRQAQAERLRTVSLLLYDKQADSVTIARFYKKKTVFYISTAGSMEAVTIGSGKLSMRIAVEAIPGKRGLCNVTMTPVCPTSKQNLNRFLKRKAGSGDFVFDSVGLTLKMSPGEFFFLGPKKYSDNRATLGSLFFSKTGDKPAIRVYVVICTKVTS